VSPGVSPRTALAVGLKVDVHALPARSLRKEAIGDVSYRGARYCPSRKSSPK
jgi:hypothetical protein